MQNYLSHIGQKFTLKIRYINRGIPIKARKFSDCETLCNVCKFMKQNLDVTPTKKMELILAIVHSLVTL